MTVLAEKAPSLGIEEILWNGGVCRIAGIDEAGRGAWAGPVVAAAVILDRQRVADLAPCVFDSKLLTAKARTEAAVVIRREAVAVGVGVIPVDVIDRAGLAFAGQLAFWRAVKDLASSPEFLLVDGFPLWSEEIPQAAILQGDRRSLSIAAASIIAKVTRDSFMTASGREFPAYGFGRHKGYGSAAHASALTEHGPSPLHRRSFKPVAARGT